MGVAATSAELNLLCHELNNALGIVVQLGHLAGRELEPGSQAAADLDQLVEHARRAASIADSISESAAVPLREPGGPPTVLVIEDDPTMLDLVVTTLRDDGFEALGVHSVGEALIAAVRHAFAIDLVLTDLGVPALTAARLPAVAESVAAAPPVLVMSGTAIDPTLGVARLAKPFSPDELLGAVGAVLDRDDSWRR